MQGANAPLGEARRSPKPPRQVFPKEFGEFSVDGVGTERLCSSGSTARGRNDCKEFEGGALFSFALCCLESG